MRRRGDRAAVAQVVDVAAWILTIARTTTRRGRPSTATMVVTTGTGETILT
ncbi:hypothetical protein [Sphingomonas montana]|uniref:hypothetical protein n=1 Tax=Sphingomonas montana TaxID=1843236 RepID=UPI0013ECAC07|nr:hypothetical protein [Sphingomonas montana]